MNPSHLDAPLERLIRGKHHWWFLGPGGIARIYENHLTSDGELGPKAIGFLQDQGMYRVHPVSSYILTVLTSTDCNLGCGYCFQNTGQDAAGGNRPPRIAHARLTSETITSVLGFGARQMAKAGLDRLRILLFGGEPLLNPRGCLELLTRAADYGLVSAAMISNMTLMTPRLAEQLADAKLRSVQVTFDGDRDDHDRIRVRRSGGGSFDSIVRNLGRASEVAPAIRWALRVNVSHHNRPSIDRLIDRVAGMVDPARCTMYFARVGDASIGYQNEMDRSAELAAEFVSWKLHALDAGFSIGRPSCHAPCQTCSFRDGRYGAVISADGTLSSCWDTAGKPAWQVGTILDGYLAPDETARRWVSCEDCYEHGASETEMLTFQDAVDAAILDHLSDSGRL